jgi:uncharacterized membrane protein
MNHDLPISLLLAAFMGALMLLIPHISPQRYFFAITVPSAFRSSDAGRASLRRYYAAVVCSVVIAVVALVRLADWPWQLLPLLAILTPVILGILAFLWERRQVARVAPPADAVRVAELTPDDDRLPRWIALVLPPFAFPLAAAAWLRAHWNQIPTPVPIHWGLNNVADRWADKTARAVYGPLLFAGGMMLVMILLTLAMFYGSRRGRQRTAIVQMMVATIYFLALLFSAIAIMPAVPFSPAMLVIPGLLFPLVLLLWVTKVLRDPKMPAESTPDNCWYLGSIYVNAEDPAIFVQRRIGFGYTINMGNRLAWLVLAGFVAALGGLVFTLPR